MIEDRIVDACAAGLRTPERPLPARERAAKTRVAPARRGKGAAWIALARRSKRIGSFVALIACACVCAFAARAQAVGGAESAAPDAAAAPAEGAPGAPGAARPGSGVLAPKRVAPEEMVLCRGPRGVVYARAAAQGCSKGGSQLTPRNLVDFGAGSSTGGCALRPIAGSSAASDCHALCRAADPKSTCVIGLAPAGEKGWATFSIDTALGDLGAARERALAVCCDQGRAAAPQR